MRPTSAVFVTSVGCRRIRRGRRTPTSPTSRPVRSAWVRPPRCSPLRRAATSSPTSGPSTDQPTRFIALVGDAELDEGNIWEAITDPALQRTRQRDVGRRRQPAEPRPRHTGDEGSEADAGLRGLGLACRRGEVRPDDCAPRSSVPAERHCGDTSTTCRTRSTSRCSVDGGTELRDRFCSRSRRRRFALRSPTSTTTTSPR